MATSFTQTEENIENGIVNGVPVIFANHYLTAHGMGFLINLSVSEENTTRKWQLLKER